MLEMLDVAIGFAAVMLAFSLIIMSLTQSVASLLALRGRRLRRGLEELIKYAAPSLSERAHEVSARIVKHPLISDSAVRGQGPWNWASAIKHEELIPVLENVLGGASALKAEEKAALEAWFDSFMARVSQWFVMNTRWITVGLAVLLSVALHVDSIRIATRLREDSVTRAKITAMSSTLLDQTPEMIRDVETSYLDAVREVVAANAGQFKEETSADGITIASRTQAAGWIRDRARTFADGDDLVRKFDAAVTPKLSDRLNASIDRAKTLQASLTSAGIGLYGGQGHDWWDWTRLTSSHFWGIAASVLFLSLGAPFWFNVLKKTASLRSVVAQKESEEEQLEASREARGAAPGRRQLAPLPPKPPADAQTGVVQA
jgi:hypothetical protein